MDVEKFTRNIKASKSICNNDGMPIV